MLTFDLKEILKNTPVLSRLFSIDKFLNVIVRGTIEH